jgi:hypothetical protein
VRHDYPVVDRQHHIRVDCETKTHVIEVGFDGKRSSRDSVHQALFAAGLSGKLPMVVIIDTNGLEENIQYQVETVSSASNVSYMTVTEDYLVRWRMTAPFRQAANLFQISDGES